MEDKQWKSRPSSTVEHSLRKGEVIGSSPMDGSLKGRGFLPFRSFSEGGRIPEAAQTIT